MKTLTISILFTLCASSALATPTVTENDIRGYLAQIQEMSPQKHLMDPSPLFITEGVELPRIMFIDEAEMALMSGTPAGHVIAMYESYNSTVYLLDDIDLESIEGQSILLHELVHHVQNVSGVTDKNTNCPINLEFDAYKIQMAFLEENKDGVRPEFVKNMKANQIFASGIICYEDRVTSTNGPDVSQ
jgi:hypothetical protein